jgi:AcrR family transcriptional regulator
MTESNSQGAARVAVRRPQRADNRNFDALIAAAREVFAADGVNGSLKEIARRAGVGIGRLHRNFPTRQALFEAVYVDEVEALAQAADGPLLKRAQDVGKVRTDVSFEDVRYLINGVSGSNFTDDAQRERVLTITSTLIRPQAR